MPCVRIDRPAPVPAPSRDPCAALHRLQDALRAGNATHEHFGDVDDALAWAALDAAGIQGAWRDAVVAAGGARAVLCRGALSSFSSPQRRTRLLDRADLAQRLDALRPWLASGGRVVVDEELLRFSAHPVCCFYGCGEGRVPLPRALGGPPVVAVVGSREATAGWLRRAERLARALAGRGVVVVSGGAVGVDRAAQHAARAAGGDVVVIHGSVARPPPEILRDPALCWLTPYGPWRTGAPRLFAERNAWIAACADVVVVLCGAARSGTRHTVDAAVRLRRPVVTVATDEDDPLGAMPARLAARGALVVDDDDIDVDALLAAPLLGEPPRPPSPAAAATATRDLPALVRLLRQSGPLLIDDAAARLCLPMRELLAEVALLELDGAVRRDGALLQLP